jgi:hypothetical protein
MYVSEHSCINDNNSAKGTDGYARKFHTIFHDRRILKLLLILWATFFVGFSLGNLFASLRLTVSP